MPGPRLGELAVGQGVVDQGRLDTLLRAQNAQRARGQFTPLGELLTELRVPRAKVRGLLRQQGLELLACELCGTRYGALVVRGQPACMRCGRRLLLTPDDAPLSTEDVVADPGPQGEALLRDHRARLPRFGRYEVLGEVGRGAVGVVYKAFDAQQGRWVALKFLQRPDETSPEELRRFQREAKAIAALRHENILQAWGLEEAPGMTCMVLEFIPGVSLEALLEKKVVTPFRAVEVCARIARALHHAHEAGIVHRDVKPANIVVSYTGKPYLVDFGIAKARTESVSLTMEGEVVGSVAYMAPEYLAQGVSAVTRQIDVYGLGVVLYEAAADGAHPYGDPASEELVMDIVQKPAVGVLQRNPRVPPALARIIDRAVAKDRKVRHPTAEALALELEEFLAAAGRS